MTKIPYHECMWEFEEGLNGDDPKLQLLLGEDVGKVVFTADDAEGLINVLALILMPVFDKLYDGVDFDEATATMGTSVEQEIAGWEK